VNNPILVLAAVQLIESLAFALPISFFPNYVVELGASVASVGLFTSSFMMAFAVLSPKIGELTARATFIILLIEEPSVEEKAPQFPEF
jgi:hypothetical protein